MKNAEMISVKTVKRTAVIFHIKQKFGRETKKKKKASLKKFSACGSQ